MVCLKSYVSSEVHDSFRSVSLLKCNLPGSMTQGDKERWAERRREMQGRRDDERDVLEKDYFRLSYFSNPVGKNSLDIPQ